MQSVFKKGIQKVSSCVKLHLSWYAFCLIRQPKRLFSKMQFRSCMAFRLGFEYGFTFTSNLFLFSGTLNGSDCC